MIDKKEADLEKNNMLSKPLNEIDSTMLIDYKKLIVSLASS